MSKNLRRLVRTPLRASVALTLLAASTVGIAQAAVASATTQAAQAHSSLPAGFAEHRTRANGITVDYVRGGHGPTLVLLHGYPETWYEYRDVLPTLARHYTVIAPDLRGAGGSSAPATGYDKKTMAQDVYALLTELGLQHHIDLVGHDIGSMVAYSYAAQHPDEVSRLVLSEAPIPDQSIYRFPALTAQGPGVWNFGFFNVTDGLPEQMIHGREQTWVDLFIRMFAVRKDAAAAPDAVSVYARGISDPAHLRASLGWFRSLGQDIRDNAVLSKKPLPMPVLAVGASNSLGANVADQVRTYAAHVQGVVIPNSGHWIFEEHPQEMAQLLMRFFG
ncbi:alpha/beta fold hydrolase [Streptacidiphilus anmyonensis]|uniref:alpha/beta fold hydrolase n=1 Tax=Streptacidiphilus anmyonensis TaxID=405782 RepID=UPI0005A895DE|nr:alpha/beta hydrolase [Streptacidiphilus anmyonensis]